MAECVLWPAVCSLCGGGQAPCRPYPWFPRLWEDGFCSLLPPASLSVALEFLSVPACLMITWRWKHAGSGPLLTY